MGIRSVGEELSLWQKFVSLSNIGEALSVADIFLTIIGFTITVIAAFKAQSAAKMAKKAAESATQSLVRVDVIAEIAAILHLLEELKRLQRAKAAEVLADRYSSLRARLVGLRESRVLGDDTNRSAIQDVVTRLASLERMIDQDPATLENPKKIASCNQSLSLCTDALLGIKERLRMNLGSMT